jgi:hypothetical protein
VPPAARRPIPCRGGALLGCGGESGRSAVEIILDDLDQRRFDRHPAVPAAVAVDMNNGAIVGTSKVTDVGT